MGNAVSHIDVKLQIINEFCGIYCHIKLKNTKNFLTSPQCFWYSSADGGLSVGFKSFWACKFKQPAASFTCHPVRNKTGCLVQRVSHARTNAIFRFQLNGHRNCNGVKAQGRAANSGCGMRSRRAWTTMPAASGWF